MTLFLLIFERFQKNYKAKDDNIDLKASFDSFIVIRTRSSIVGTKCPTPSGNVIPEPVRNRVKLIVISHGNWGQRQMGIKFLF